jgi:hypothetical protein
MPFLGEIFKPSSINAGKNLAMVIDITSPTTGVVIAVEPDTISYKVCSGARKRPISFVRLFFRYKSIGVSRIQGDGNGNG